MKELITRYKRGLALGGLFLADGIAIVISFYVADLLRFHVSAASSALPHMSHDMMFQPILLAVVTFLPTLWMVGPYEIPHNWGRLDLLFSLLIAVSLGLVGFLGMSYMLKEFWYSRLMVGIFGVVAWVCLFGVRVLLKTIMSWCYQRGIGVLRLVIVGDSEVSRLICARIAKNTGSGFRVVGHLVASDEKGGGNTEKIDRLETAFKALQDARPHLCLFSESIHGKDEMSYLLTRCQEEGIGVWLGTDLHQRFSPRMELSDVLSIPVIVVGSLRLAAWERVLKRALDILCSAVLIILSAPFLLYSVIRIRKIFGGSVLSRQKRVGFQGQTFTILSLRTTPANGAAFLDFLRTYSLDKLPQLWNVFRGEMSLVGPCPESQERVRRYSPWNRRRLQVKPGITGFAQIAGVRRDEGFDTKSPFDVRYVECQSLLIDFKILLRTPLVVLTRRFGQNSRSPLRGDADLARSVQVIKDGTLLSMSGKTLPRMERFPQSWSGEGTGRKKEKQIPC